ncbi:MAG: hypothetical protein R3F59_24430 [Myxococcota bacterium]
MTLLALPLLYTTGCVVYRDDYDSTWTSDTGAYTAPPPMGQIDVTWRLGSAGCEAAGVTTVAIDVDGAVTEAPCADEGALLDAASGKHRLTLRGLDVDGIARYEADVEKIVVDRGEVTTVPTVVLEAMPAGIRATWFFENGRLCAANGVATLQFDLFDDNDVIRASTEVPCDDSAADLGEIEAGSYVLTALGRDPQGAATFHGAEPVEAGRGDWLSVDVMLQPED